ncbi:MAG TPA: plastocyanin/azurin family copper-binding protein [Longimicrobiales bacterium]|nr:plastocyanin/azurin family copper-binding protein [Longimicrobiales bacterium]
MNPGRGRIRAGALVAIVVAGPVLYEPAAAQSLLLRPPNLGGTWVARPGVLQFHFLHRFSASDPPARKVLNSPTFLLAAGLPVDAMVGARYATSSAVRLGFPNEWEFFARWNPTLGSGGARPLSLHAAWNQAAESLDAELTGALEFSPVRLIGVVRGFTSPYAGEEARGAVGVGVVVRLLDWLALAGDASSLLDRAGGEDIAWGAGLHARIPTTPHTMSLHASNVLTTTLEGASVGTEDVRFGFEFTVPLTLSRWFGGAPEAAAGVRADLDVRMTDDLRFIPDTVRVRVGQSIRWVNDSRLVHTVTADPGRAQQESSVALPEGAPAFDSGALSPGQQFVRNFDLPGMYRYVCLPHEGAGMIGTIVVVP